MDPMVALAAALVGYVAGNISMARLMAARVDPSVDVTRIEVELGNGETFISTSVSGTAARMRLGTRYGVLVALLDMAKVAVPTLAFALLFPDQPYRYIVAAAGLIGHDWPILHRFLGGRGESSIYGALAVLDPIGAVATIVVSAGLGFVTGSILVLRWGGMVLMIGWAWLVRGDPAFVAYMAFAVVTYLFAMRGELGQYFSMRGDSVEPSNEEIAVEFAMGARLGRAIDRYGLPALIGRLRSRGADV